MKKIWNKPLFQTLSSRDMSRYIKAAARSWCNFGVLR